MGIFPLLCVVAFTGAAKGAGVLPEGPLKAAVGETVMFDVTPGKPFLTLTWEFGDKRIITFSGTNITEPEYEGRITLFMSTGSLELRNVTLNDSGVYTVSLIPFGQLEQKGNTRLEVYAPISNVTLTVSSNDLVEFNDTVSLFCSSSGSSPSFLWLNSSSNVQITDGGSTLNIINVTRYDQGPFRCHVFNPVSNGTSDEVTLTINYGPENTILTISPSQKHYVEGSNITLSCSAVSKPEAQFYWFLDGHRLNDTGPDLRLMNIQTSQSGNYSCQAFNSKTMRYDTPQSSVVSVMEKVSGATLTSSAENPIEGNSFNLTCEASGSALNRTWMKDGAALIPDNVMSLYDSDTVLSFKSLKRTTQDGKYSCNISNPVSSSEVMYNMVVKYGPENVKITGPHDIRPGETLTLTCDADSEPPAIYTWTLNGTEIQNSYSSEFTKEKVEISDSGIYVCQAKNDITGKSSSAEHKVNVTGIPVTPTSSGCSAGCIAGIVIGCLCVIGVVIGVGIFFFLKKRGQRKSNKNVATVRGGEGQNKTAQAGSQELTYADVKFSQNRNGGAVQFGQSELSEYAQVNVNNSTPPSYDDHIQRGKRPAPQPYGNVAPTYADVQRK